MRTLSVDPGFATGVVLGEYGDKEQWRRLDYWTVTDGCYGFIRWWRHGRPAFDVLISERFVIDGTITGTWSAQIEGFLMGEVDSIVWQGRFQKDMVTPDVLKRLGLWLTPKQVGFKTAAHVLDATRHSLVYCRSIDHVPTLNAMYVH